MDAKNLEDGLAVELLGVVLTENVEWNHVDERIDGRLVLDEQIRTRHSPQRPRHLSECPTPAGVIRATEFEELGECLERRLRNELPRRVVHVHGARNAQSAEFFARKSRRRLFIQCSFKEFGRERVSVVVDVLDVSKTGPNEGVDDTSSFDLVTKQEARVGTFEETFGRESKVQ